MNNMNIINFENLGQLIKTFVDSGVTFFETGFILLIMISFPFVIYFTIMEGIRFFDHIMATKFNRYRYNSTYIKMRKKGWKVNPPKFDKPIFDIGLAFTDENKE